MAAPPLPACGQVNHGGFMGRLTPSPPPSSPRLGSVRNGGGGLPGGAASVSPIAAAPFPSRGWRPLRPPFGAPGLLSPRVGSHAFPDPWRQRDWPLVVAAGGIACISRPVAAARLASCCHAHGRPSACRPRFGASTLTLTLTPDFALSGFLRAPFLRLCDGKRNEKRPKC